MKLSSYSNNIKLVLFCSSIAFFVSSFIFVTIAFHPIVITSNSMEPTINVGDVTFIETNINKNALKVGQQGDIIVIKNYSIFTDNDVPSYLFSNLKKDTPIVHRAIEKRVVKNHLYFVTKGDNNDYPDGCIKYSFIDNNTNYFEIECNASDPVLIPEEYVLGKVVFVVPYIGFIKLYSNFIFLYLSTLMIIAIYNYIKNKRIKNENKNLIHLSTCE
ncbi:MAG: signal peptidase I [Promethearchaeota archaeon]